jgi:chromosome segregation ATPase
VNEDDLGWLGDLRWQGYPHMQPMRDVVSEAAVSAAPYQQPAHLEPTTDPKLAELARDNELLRAKIDQLTKLAGEFDRRLKEAGNAYEGAVLDVESRLRDAIFERERLNGELQAAKAESSRLTTRDATREADLRIERERRNDAEKSLAEARQELRDYLAKIQNKPGPTGDSR